MILAMLPHLFPDYLSFLKDSEEYGSGVEGDRNHHVDFVLPRVDKVVFKILPIVARIVRLCAKRTVGAGV